MGIGAGIAFLILLSAVSSLAICVQLVVVLYLSEWTLRNAGYIEDSSQRNRYLKFFLRVTVSFVFSVLSTFFIVTSDSDLLFSVLYYSPVFLFLLMFVLLGVYMFQEGSRTLS